MRRLSFVALALLLACNAGTEPAAPPADAGSAPIAAAEEATPSPPAAPSAPAATTDRIDVAGLKARLAGGARVIDVRAPAEYAAGHVPGAINIPIDQLEALFSQVTSDPAAPVYFICAVGGRSARAVEIARARGLASPVNVEGGTMAWVSAGYPVE